MICTWLSERMDRGLHSFQLAALSHIAKVSITQFLTFTFIYIMYIELFCFTLIYYFIEYLEHLFGLSFEIIHPKFLQSVVMFSKLRLMFIHRYLRVKCMDNGKKDYV